MPDNADLSTLTPTDHVRTLDRLASDIEGAVKHFLRAGESPTSGIALRYAKRAAAIRWILKETAHGVDERDLVV